MATATKSKPKATSKVTKATTPEAPRDPKSEFYANGEAYGCFIVGTKVYAKTGMMTYDDGYFYGEATDDGGREYTFVKSGLGYKVKKTT